MLAVLALAGCTGDQGEMGEPGEKGDTGETGAMGSQGSMGVTGVVKLLFVEAGNQALTSLATNVDTYPAACTTEAYVAAAGDVALVQINTSVFPPAPVASIVYSYVGASENGGAMTGKSTPSGEGLNDGAASSTAQAMLPLTAGVSYKFAGGVTSSGNVQVAKFACHVSVQILRT